MECRKLLSPDGSHSGGKYSFGHLMHLTYVAYEMTLKNSAPALDVSVRLLPLSTKSRPAFGSAIIFLVLNTSLKFATPVFSLSS